MPFVLHFLLVDQLSFTCLERGQEFQVFITIDNYMERNMRSYWLLRFKLQNAEYALLQMMVLSFLSPKRAKSPIIIHLAQESGIEICMTLWEACDWTFTEQSILYTRGVWFGPSMLTCPTCYSLIWTWNIYLDSLIVWLGSRDRTPVVGGNIAEDRLN